MYGAIEAVYKSVKCIVRTKYGDSDMFSCPLGLRQGCSLSPILFALFINEFYDILSKSNIRGVQLYPDIIEIFLLMFADDIASLSDTVNGLQKQLNILQDYCDEYKLSVNVEKTKILVFKNGGRLSRHEKWFYCNNAIQTVNGFDYVGIHFTSRLSLYKMSESMAVKAKRVFLYVLNSIKDYKCLLYKVFFKSFDTKISPILLYGSEIWGLDEYHCVENVHVFACKQLLGVKPNTCNDAIMGDLARYPMYIYSAKRCIKYWLRLLSLTNDRYVKLCYNMLVFMTGLEIEIGLLW